MKEKNSKKKLRLGEILVEQGVLTSADVDRALEKQKHEGGLLGQVLIRMGLVTEEDIVLALARQYNYPYLPIQNCNVSQKVLDLVPIELIKKHHIIPIDQISDVLTIIMADPTNEYAKKDIEEATKLRLQVLVGTVTEIHNAMRKYYKIKDVSTNTNVVDNLSISFHKAINKKGNASSDKGK